MKSQKTDFSHVPEWEVPEPLEWEVPEPNEWPVPEPLDWPVIEWEVELNEWEFEPTEWEVDDIKKSSLLNTIRENGDYKAEQLQKSFRR